MGPTFTIPSWPSRLNPHVEEMRRRSLRWARDAGIVRGEEEVRRLDGPRFDRLAGYAHPDARGPGAQLVSDWMFWFFPFDDWFDGPVGEDPGQVRAAVDPMVRFVYGESGALPLSAPPPARAFADSCGRSRMGMTASWQGRFAEDVATYLFSYVLEARMRRDPGEGGMDHVVEVRRNAIGVRPSLAFGETAQGQELAFPLVLSEPFHRLRTVCAASWSSRTTPIPCTRTSLRARPGAGRPGATTHTTTRRPGTRRRRRPKRRHRAAAPYWGAGPASDLAASAGSGRPVRCPAGRAASVAPGAVPYLGAAHRGSRLAGVQAMPTVYAARWPAPSGTGASVIAAPESR
ncbi:hypothetical protein [Streptomyces sp. ICC1]|uniref:terpene synthase family protein n=1 Tax=Streptomyces sp. ICC1 TaxID=2099583 RepID=UPI000DC7593B|nr:hypothetical protein [Streptomyces sp. ICC1]AWZ16148.1 hypothetical protein DRB96_32285 [Streptomyces sp. ICC1]